MNDLGVKDTANITPRTFNGDIGALPAALSPLYEKDQWVIWRWTENGSDKWTKPPLQARFPHQLAKNNDPATWSSHAAAAQAVREGAGNGIGFALTGTAIAAIDLDHCRDPKTGAIDTWAQHILDQARGAYIEVTVSGSGLRVVGTATGQKTHKNYKVDGSDGAKVELYRRAVRYITVSGVQIGECNTLPNIDALISAMHSNEPRSGFYWTYVKS